MTPSGWRYGRLKWDTRLVPGGTPATDETDFWLDGDDPDGVPFVAIGDMSQRRLVHRTAKSITNAGMASKTMPVGTPGTILLAMYASVGEVSVLNVRATWNQAILGITPDPARVHAPFLTYALLSMKKDLLGEVRSNTQSNLNSRQVGDVWYLRPSIAVQRAIADFLDRETAQIDTLIAKQEQLINTLKERRAALVTSAVTRGIRQPDHLIDSRDSMLGAVPGHWDVVRIGRVTDSLDAIRVPLSGEERGERKGEFPYYGASGVIDHIDDFLFDEPLVLVSEDGANLLARSTPIAFSAHGRYWVNNHAHVLRPRYGPAEYWAERIEAIDVSPIVTGSAQPKLTAEALRALRVAVPRVPEMIEIVAYLDEQTSKIDILIDKAKGFIALAKERRSALITAAVTGQIDVLEDGAA